MNAATRAWSPRTCSEYSKSITCPFSMCPFARRSAGSMLSQHAFDAAPSQFCHRPRALPGFHRLRAGRGADLRALGDALQDRRNPEQAERQIEIPVVDAIPPGALAITPDVCLFRR